MLLTLVLGSLTGSRPLPSANEVRHSVTPAEAARIAAAAGYINSRTCFNRCITCDWFIVSYDDGFPRNSGYGAQDCIYFNCGSCDGGGFFSAEGGQDAKALVLSAVSSDDPEMLARLIESSQKLRYNEKRGALQMIGCDGKGIMASFPVTRALHTVAMSAARGTGRLVTDE